MRTSSPTSQRVVNRICYRVLYGRMTCLAWMIEPLSPSSTRYHYLPSQFTCIEVLKPVQFPLNHQLTDPLQSY